MKPLWVIFCMCLGSFLTIFILSMFQLAGGHTHAEDVLDGWGVGISALFTLLSLFAVIIKETA